MITEIKTYLIKCDNHAWGCKSKKVLQAEDEPISPPKGWKYKTLHDCGSTGYSTKKLLCPKCFKNYKD